MYKRVIVWAMLHDWKCSFCLQVAMVLAAIVLLAAGAAAQPFQPGTGFAPLGMLWPLLLLASATIRWNWAFTVFTRLYHPLWCHYSPCLCSTCHLIGCSVAGNLRTQDRDGPYNLTLLPVQVNEVRGESIPQSILILKCPSTLLPIH